MGSTFPIRYNPSIDRIIFFLSLATLVTFLPLFLTAPKNIFTVLLLVALGYKFFVRKEKLTIEADKVGIIALLLFLAALILSSAFSDMPLYSFKMLFKHYFAAFLMSFGFLVSIRSKKDLEILIFALAGTTIFTDLHYYYQAYSTHHTWNFTLNTFQIDRNFSYVIPLLLPFLLSSWFLVKKIHWKTLILLGIVLTLVLALLTGRRAGYFSVGMEMLFFLFFYIKTMRWRGSFKSVVAVAIISLVVGVGVLMSVSKTTQFQAAIERGLSPNGRDVIIKDRFSVLNDYFVLGAGYGKEIYNATLEANNVPHRLGRNENGRFNYSDDEGTYIQVLFRNGIAGFTALLIFLFYPLYRLFRHPVKIDPFYLVMWSIGVLTLEQYVLRGLVETFILSNLLPFFAIFIRADVLYKAEPDYSR